MKEPIEYTHRILHEDMHDAGAIDLPTVESKDDTNNARLGNATSLLIRDRVPNRVEPPKSIRNETNTITDEVIIPPPPFFDTDVSVPNESRHNLPSLSPLRAGISDDDDESGLLPITVIPEHIVLPASHVAETTMQSTDSTNSPENEYPPPINYSNLPNKPSLHIQLNKPMQQSVTTQTPSPQVFLFPSSRISSSGSSDFYSELTISPGREPDPPELLQVHYKTLPTVAHVPNSPCHLHPDQTFVPYPQNSDIYDSVNENTNIPPMFSSVTYPFIDPYPSLTTVAGTYNPYSCGRPVCNDSNCHSHKQKSPNVPISPILKDINQNVTPTNPQINLDGVPKSVHSERRVHFGEVSTVPESIRHLPHDSVSGVERARSPHVPDSKPARSSKIKAFAIGEVMTNIRLTHT